MRNLENTYPNVVTEKGSNLFGSDETIDVMSLVGIVRRRKWLILSIAAVGALLGAALGLQMVPTYTAKSAIMLDPRQNNVVNVQAVLSGLPPDAATIATQIGLLQSRSFVSRVMDDLKLFDDPEFNPALRDPDQSSGPLAELLQPLQGLLGYLPPEWLAAVGLGKDQPNVLESEAPRLAHEAAIVGFGKDLLLANDGTSYLINISFTSVDPDKAAVVANRIGELFVGEQLKTKLGANDKASGWLEDRLSQLRTEVQQAEAAVAKYKSTNNLVDTQQGSVNDQQLSDLNQQLITIRADLAEKQAKLRLVKDLRAHGQSLASISDVTASPLIVKLREDETDLLRQEAELRTLYGDKHPRMLHLQNEKKNLEDKITAEVDRIIVTLNNDVQIAQTRAGSLEGQLAVLKGQNVQDRTAEVKLHELEAAADTSRQIYATFLQRYTETRDQQDITDPDVRVVSVAAPPNLPSSPSPKLFVAAGFTVSFLFGTVLALVLERLDRGIRSSREVEAAFGLGTIGLVPRIDRLKRNQRLHQYLREKPLSAYAEAIRGVYTALKLANPKQPPKVVMVTSSLPAEGKTTLAASLATLAARSLKKVLLIDLDLRHPSVHRELGWQVSAGLVEYMAGERTLQEVIHHDLESGLHFLPIKAQTTNPTELIESDKMRELIESCRENYDYIVVDSAPLASVTDGKLCAQLVDKVIFVVHWGKTVESAVRDSLQALRDAGVEPAGVVLTQIDLRKHAQYGYGDIGQYYTRSQRYYVN